MTPEGAEANLPAASNRPAAPAEAATGQHGSVSGASTSAPDSGGGAGRQVGLGTALVAVSGASFGVMPILAKLVYADGGSPVGLLAARFTIGGLLLLALARWRGEALPRGRLLGQLIALGAVGYAAESLCYFVALDHASAGVVALLLYLYPGLVVLAVAVTTRHRPSRVTLSCLAVAVAGTALTVGPSGGADRWGVALGLGAAVSYAAYIVLSGRLLVGVGPIAACAVVMSATAVTDDVLALATGADYPRSASGWAGIVATAVVCTVVAVGTFFAGLARVGAARASIVSTVEPVVSVALGVAVLGEPMSLWQGAGGLLVLSAVAVLALRREDAAVPPEAADSRARAGVVG